jgi:hypothetical protein
VIISFSSNYLSGPVLNKAENAWCYSTRDEFKALFVPLLALNEMQERRNTQGETLIGL